ncbi:hypothetical protein PMAYCL1PPCAC_17733, partial [Pristionchus mayeri]
KLPSLLALLSLVVVVCGVGTTAGTKQSVTANIPGKGEDPKEIQENIDRIQGEIKDLNAKVANLLAALNETNAVPFLRIDELTTQILDQKTKLDKVNENVLQLSTQIDLNDKNITYLQNNVNCFTNSGCGPEKF